MSVQKSVERPRWRKKVAEFRLYGGRVVIAIYDRDLFWELLEKIRRGEISFDEVPSHEKEKAKEERASEKQIRYIEDLVSQIYEKEKILPEELKREAELELGIVIDRNRLTKEEASRVIEWLQERVGVR